MFLCFYERMNMDLFIVFNIFGIYMINMNDMEVFIFEVLLYILYKYMYMYIIISFWYW